MMTSEVLANRHSLIRRRAKINIYRGFVKVGVGRISCVFCARLRVWLSAVSGSIDEDRDEDRDEDGEAVRWDWRWDMRSCKSISVGWITHPAEHRGGQWPLQ